MRIKLTKLAFGAFLGLFLAMAATACGEDGQIEIPQISIDSKSVTIPAEGGSVTVKADVPAAWSVSTDATWVSVTPSSGESGPQTITFSAKANETGETRETKAVLSATVYEQTQSVTITVSQPSIEVTPPPPAPSITLAYTTLTAPADGGTHTLSLRSNVAWKATAGASWLSVSPSSGEAGDATVTLSLEANSSQESRSVTVTFTAGEAEASLAVTQEGKAPEGVVLDGSVNGWEEGGVVDFEQIPIN